MPVSRLLVEGALDAELLRPILAGSPEVAIGGSKYSLAPKARTERELRQINVCYLRDRDFDFDPPEHASQPVVDREHEGSVLGWRWCRHEIENYLLDPKLVTAAMGWDEAVYTAALVQAAQRIRFYQISRWVVGTARRSLPPQYELNTRPQEVQDSEIRLPTDLTEAAAARWTTDHVAAFYVNIQVALAPETIAASLAQRAASIGQTLFESTASVLLWCSGKDLMAALNPGSIPRGLRTRAYSAPSYVTG